MLRNTKDQFGAMTKTFHWVTALIVIGLVAVGFYMGDMPIGAAKIKTYNLHKSFGITVLMMTLCRILWNNIDKRPVLDDKIQFWEKPLLTPMHTLFYVLLIAMPLSGWLMSSTGGGPVAFFGLFTLPDLMAPDKAVSKIFRQAHEIIGITLAVMAGLHVAEAVKHHFIDKDPFLRRMLPVIAALVLLSLPASAEEPYAAQRWDVMNRESSISFSVRQMNTECKGAFDRFTSSVFFDPDDLANSHARVDIDLVSVNTQAMDRDEALRGQEWFDITHFPAARFETTAFRKTGDNAYEADATLTIRDVTVPLKLPFTLSIEDKGENKIEVVMDSSIVLDRSQLKLGKGEWADTSIIGNDVSVHIHVVARANYKNLTLRPSKP
jgi:cytochrome b561